jgi:hypothetical protein
MRWESLFCILQENMPQQIFDILLYSQRFAKGHTGQRFERITNLVPNYPEFAPMQILGSHPAKIVEIVLINMYPRNHAMLFGKLSIGGNMNA